MAGILHRDGSKKYQPIWPNQGRGGGPMNRNGHYKRNCICQERSKSKYLIIQAEGLEFSNQEDVIINVNFDIDSVSLS